MKAVEYIAQHEHHRVREIQFSALTMLCLITTIAAGAPLALIIATVAAGGVAAHHNNRKAALEHEEHGAP